MTQVGRSISGRSAAASYRKDVAGRNPDDAFGANDGTWIAVASLLEHAAAIGPDDGAALVAEAIELAVAVVDTSARSLFAARAGEAARSRGTEAIQRLTQQLEDAGAMNLAAMTLDSLAAADHDMTVLERGRVMTQRARIMWKVGNLEGAHRAYRRIARLAKDSGETELRVRALMGYTAIAQIRREFGEMRRHGRSAAKLATRHGYPALAQLAHGGLFVAAAAANDFDEALLEGWSLYELAGSDQIALAEVLVNLGQLLFDAGRPEASRAAFASVLSKTQPVRIGLPALGGFALACAELGERQSVLWAVDEMDREAQHANQPYHVARVLAECATALARIGEFDAARHARNSAIAIAVANGFDEVAANAARSSIPSSLSMYPPPCALTPRASRVARQIGLLQPREFPSHVSFVAAA